MTAADTGGDARETTCSVNALDPDTLFGDGYSRLNIAGFFGPPVCAPDTTKAENATCLFRCYNGGVGLSDAQCQSDGTWAVRFNECGEFRP